MSQNGACREQDRRIYLLESVKNAVTTTCYPLEGLNYFDLGLVDAHLFLLTDREVILIRDETLVESSRDGILNPAGNRN